MLTATLTFINRTRGVFPLRWLRRITTMDNEGMLQALFSSVGEEYGYREVTAGFAPERDLKVVWVRSHGWIDFWVSDYLEDAPADVLESVADTIFGRISTHENVSYSRPLVDYVTSEEFLARNRPLYISRINGVSRDTRGRHTDLSDSYRRLIDRGLIEDDPSIIIRWAPMAECSDTCHSSILMRTVCIARRLDNVFVPADVLDFILFSQIAFVQEDFEQNPSNNILHAKETLRGYPEYERLMGDVAGMGLKLWRDVSPAN